MTGDQVIWKIKQTSNSRLVSQHGLMLVGESIPITTTLTLIARPLNEGFHFSSIRFEGGLYQSTINILPPESR